MTKKDEPIPTWVGRAVSTDELGVSRDALSEAQPETTVGGNSPRSSDPSTRTEGTSAMPADSGPTGLSRLVPLLLGLVFTLGLLLGVGYALGWFDRSAESETTATSAGEDETPVTEASTLDVDEDPSTSEATALGTAASNDGTTAEGDAEAAAGDPQQLDPQLKAAYGARAAADGEQAWALYRDGVIYLEGEVPSQAFADAMREDTAELGPGLVRLVENYTINPDAPIPLDPPLFLRESVTFEEGSATVERASERIVNAAPFAVVSFFPSATLTIISYAAAGADGSPDEELAQARADAIIDRWEPLGIQRDKVSVEIASPEDAAEVNATGVEFVVRNLTSR